MSVFGKHQQHPAAQQKAKQAKLDEAEFQASETAGRAEVKLDLDTAVTHLKALLQLTATGHLPAAGHVVRDAANDFINAYDAR
jgi:hypothetical protein